MVFPVFAAGLGAHTRQPPFSNVRVAADPVGAHVDVSEPRVGIGGGSFVVVSPPDAPIKFPGVVHGLPQRRLVVLFQLSVVAGSREIMIDRPPQKIAGPGGSRVEDGAHGVVYVRIVELVLLAGVEPPFHHVVEGILAARVPFPVVGIDVRHRHVEERIVASAGELRDVPEQVHVEVLPARDKVDVDEGGDGKGRFLEGQYLEAHDVVSQIPVYAVAPRNHPHDFFFSSPGFDPVGSILIIRRVFLFLVAAVLVGIPEGDVAVFAVFDHHVVGGDDHQDVEKGQDVGFLRQQATGKWIQRQTPLLLLLGRRGSRPLLLLFPPPLGNVGYAQFVTEVPDNRHERRRDESLRSRHGVHESRVFVARRAVRPLREGPTEGGALGVEVVSSLVEVVRPAGVAGRTEGCGRGCRCCGGGDRLGGCRSIRGFSRSREG